MRKDNNIIIQLQRYYALWKECTAMYEEWSKGVRDYIHVVDLAKGHVAAINKIKENPGVKIYNLGTGKGYSVLDVIHAFGKACGKEIPYEIKPRRAGDIATCYSDASLAKKELGWEAQYDIDEMCADSWKWQSMNPDGYNTPEK